MATIVLNRAQKVREAMDGKSRAQELAWYGQTLDIPDPVMLKLLGSKPSKKAAGKGATAKSRVVAVAERKPDKTIWVSELFRELVHRSGYDISRLKSAIHELPDRDQIEKPAQLLKKVAAGGPGVYESLVTYLRGTNGKV